MGIIFLLTALLQLYRIVYKPFCLIRFLLPKGLYRQARGFPGSKNYFFDITEEYRSIPAVHCFLPQLKSALISAIDIKGEDTDRACHRRRHYM
jgi:hypothetical protein